MKILSYKIENEMIRIKTDNQERYDFVYFKDKFNNLEELKLEIEKSILLENKMKEKKEKKIKKLKEDLEKEIK